MKVYVLNGPGLDLLGSREPDIYGTRTLAEVEKMCDESASVLGLTIDFRQTNDEETLIEWISQAGGEAAGIVINPAAFTHYSLAVREALAAARVPVVELHISNIYRRELWRRRSLVSEVANGVIAGLGVEGYALALRAMATLIERKADGLRGPNRKTEEDAGRA